MTFEMILAQPERMLKRQLPVLNIYLSVPGVNAMMIFINPCRFIPGLTKVNSVFLSLSLCSLIDHVLMSHTPT